MITQKYIRKSILWMARIWGSLILGFVLFFLLAHLIKPERPLAEGLQDPRDLITFICFPVLSMLGLIIAYKYEGIGGLISCVALLTAMLLNRALDLKFLLLIFPPGFLYLIYWQLSRKEKQIKRRMKLH